MHPQDEMIFAVTLTFAVWWLVVGMLFPPGHQLGAEWVFAGVIYLAMGGTLARGRF